MLEMKKRKSGLKNEFKKRMIAFGITSIYLLLVNLIIVPLVTKGHIDEFQFSQITPFIVPFIILILSDKGLKYQRHLPHQLRKS